MEWSVYTKVKLRENVRTWCHARWTFLQNYNYEKQTRDGLASIYPDNANYIPSEQYRQHNTIQRSQTFSVADIKDIVEAELITMLTRRHSSYWTRGANGAMTTDLLNDTYFPLWRARPPTGEWLVAPVWQAAMKRRLPGLGPFPNEQPAGEGDLEDPQVPQGEDDADVASEDITHVRPFSSVIPSL